MNSKINEVIWFLNGEQVFSSEPVNVSVENIEIKRKVTEDDSDLWLRSKECEIELKNVEFNKDFIGEELQKDMSYTLVCESYKFPRGNKLPKKKRIRKKWLKKYRQEYVIEDCIIR